MLGLGLYLWENNGSWESELKAKTPKKAKAKAKAKAKPAEAEPAETLPSKETAEVTLLAEAAAQKLKEAVVADIKTRLKERCRELYENNWEADEALQARIKKAVKSDDGIEMEALIKTLDDAMPALLTLHEE
tara:strand:- start:581 stop:976 length:396 start_codon:yes stop_codon:yes gene_type:complete